MSMINLREWIPYSLTFAAGSAQTDALLSPAVDAKSRFQVMELYASPDGLTTNPTAVRIGFGAANVPAAAATPVAGILLAHGGIPAGMQAAGVPGVGAADQELRITCEDPAGAAGLTVTFLGRIIPA